MSVTPAFTSLAFPRPLYNQHIGSRRWTLSISSLGEELEQNKKNNVSHLYHFLDNFGLPLTVLCHTTGKLVLLAKFWVMAMVVSRLRTTCHQPPESQKINRIPQGLLLFTFYVTP
jgi:hypothetical protein